MTCDSKINLFTYKQIKRRYQIQCVRLFIFYFLEIFTKTKLCVKSELPKMLTTIGPTINNTKGLISSRTLKKEQTIQWSKEKGAKGQTAIYKHYAEN